MQRSLSASSLLSKADYVRCIAVATIVAAAMLGFGAAVSSSWPFSIWLVLGAFVSAIVFIVITYRTDRYGISFIGVSGMMFSMGCMFGPMVAQFAQPIVVSAVVITAAVMVIMSFIGLAVPKVFEGWGPYLMAGLTLLIVAQFAQIIFILLGFSGAAKMPILTWLGIAFFLGFVAYDWAEALTLDYTLDNAVKASGALGLDFANLFVRILEVMGVDNVGSAAADVASSGGGLDLADGLEKVVDGIGDAAVGVGEAVAGAAASLLDD